MCNVCTCMHFHHRPMFTNEPDNRVQFTKYDKRIFPTQNVSMVNKATAPPVIHATTTQPFAKPFNHHDSGRRTRISPLTVVGAHGTASRKSRHEAAINGTQTCLTCYMPDMMPTRATCWTGTLQRPNLFGRRINDRTCPIARTPKNVI